MYLYDNPHIYMCEESLKHTQSPTETTNTKKMKHPNANETPKYHGTGLVVKFFQVVQPSHMVRALGLHMACLRGSQGQTERLWASLSRQAQPMRNALLATTKACLCNIHQNWRLICPDAPAKPVALRRPCLDFHVPPNEKPRLASGGPECQDEKEPGSPSSDSSSSQPQQAMPLEWQLTVAFLKLTTASCWGSLARMCALFHRCAGIVIRRAATEQLAWPLFFAGFSFSHRAAE